MRSYMQFIKNTKNVEISIFIFIIFIASFLRFYKLPHNMPFIGDQATEFIAAKDMALDGKIPLHGIHSSMPRFRQGPLYVWSLALFFKLFGYSVQNTSYYAAVMGILAVGFLYILTRKHFGRRIAFMASGILAVSPMAVAHSQFSFIINPIPLVSVLYLSSLINYIKNKSKNIFLPTLLFGILFQFELASAPLLGLIPIAFIYKEKLNKKNAINQAKHFLSGLLLGLLPQILFDISNNFKQLGMFVAWVGYRIISFFGYRAEHTISPYKLINTIGIFQHFFHKFISWDSNIIFFIFIITLFMGIKNWISLPKKSKRPISLVFWWILLLTAGYFVHGSPAEAYFPALFIPLSLAFAWTFGNITGKTPRSIATLIIAGIMTFDFMFLVRTSILSTPIVAKDNNYGTTMWNPRLKVQLQAVDIIKNKTNGPVNIKAIGPGSEFSSYLDNYRYLLWLNNVQISDDGITVWVTRGKESLNPPFINTKSYPLEGTTISIPIL